MPNIVKLYKLGASTDRGLQSASAAYPVTPQAESSIPFSDSYDTPTVFSPRLSWPKGLPGYPGVSVVHLPASFRTVIEGKASERGAAGMVKRTRAEIEASVSEGSFLQGIVPKVET